MINNPFITKHYPGWTTWLNYAQLYQAHPDDYAITRPTSGFRVTVSDTNKGARGVITFAENRKLIGYLDPNDTIYFDYNELEKDVPLVTQVFQNTSVQLNPEDIDRFERTTPESGVLYLNKETPWGVEPVQLKVVVYGKPLYTVELTFRLTEDKLIPPVALPDSIILDGVEWQTGSEIDRSVEAGVHVLHSMSTLADLAPFFQTMGKPDIVELSAVRGSQHNHYYTMMSEITTKIETVADRCIYFNEPAGTPEFWYFDVPVGQFQGDVFAPGSKMGGIGTVFQKGTYGTLPSNILKNIVFDNAAAEVRLDYMFKGATIDTVPKDLLGTLNFSGSRSVRCQWMFAETTIGVFPDDILEGLAVTSIRYFFVDASLPRFPRIIPKAHLLYGILMGEYQRVYAEDNWVTTDLFKWLDHGVSTTKYTLSDTFSGSNIRGFDPELVFNLTSVGGMTYTFSSSSLEVIPKRMFDNVPNLISLAYAFSGTNISAVPDRLFYNCSSLTTAEGVCSQCQKLAVIGSELFHPNTTLSLSTAFRSLGSYHTDCSLSRTAFSGITIKSAVNMFAGANLRNVYIDAPVIRADSMFTQATIGVLETGGLRGEFTDLSSLLSRAVITVLGDRAIRCVGVGGPIGAFSTLSRTEVILKGERLFEPLTSNQQWSLGVSGTNAQPLMGPSSTFSTSFESVTEILRYLTLPYTPNAITLMNESGVTFLAGSPQDVIDANVGITDLTTATTFIGKSTRFGATSETNRQVGILKDTKRFLGYFNNGKIKVRPLWVSYYNREFVLDGIDRRTNPEEWFSAWIAKTEYPTFERMWHGVVGDYLVFSPVGPVSAQNAVAEYNYVFSQGAELPELTFTDFGHEDWLRRFFNKECRYEFPEEHGTLSQGSQVGYYKYTVKTEYQPLYYGSTGGSPRINGFYGSMQRLIHHSIYSAPANVDYSGYTVPQIIALLKEYTGYEFLPSMFTGVVSQSEDRLVIGTTSEFLGTDFSLRLR